MGDNKVEVVVNKENDTRKIAEEKFFTISLIISCCSFLLMILNQRICLFMV